MIGYTFLLSIIYLKNLPVRDRVNDAKMCLFPERFLKKRPCYM